MTPEQLNLDTVPRGIRNNNPTNLKWVASITWHGQTGVDDKGFAIFRTPEQGIRAACINIANAVSHHQCSKLVSLIYRLTPPTENETYIYIHNICKATGWNELHQINLNTDLPTLIKQIIIQENGTCPYTDDVIKGSIPHLPIII